MNASHTPPSAMQESQARGLDALTVEGFPSVYGPGPEPADE